MGVVRVCLRSCWAQPLRGRTATVAALRTPVSPSHDESDQPVGGGYLWRGGGGGAQASAGGTGWGLSGFPPLKFPLSGFGGGGGHLSSARRGVFMLTPYRPWRSVMRLFGLSAALLVPAVAAMVCLKIWPVLSVALLTLAIAGLTFAMLMTVPLSGLSILLRIGVPSSPIGAETPRGPRVVLSALAQLPDSGGSVVFEVRSAVRDLPRGTVVVAVAQTEELARSYTRLGFSRGKGKRVFLIIDPSPTDRPAVGAVEHVQ